MKKYYRSVGEGLADYEERVVPRNAHTTQRIETRRAFYAGAQCLHSIMLGYIADLPEEKGEEVLKSIDAELERFAVAVIEGKR